jgi:uncharacterized membrane protein
MTPQIPFQRNAVEPVQCIKGGWELIKDQYWLFVGMSAVGMLIGSAVPMGILMGPMMCGMFLSFFKRMRREPVEFGTLFKGFDYFGPGVIATLLHILPIMAVVIPAYLLFYVGIIFSAATQTAGDEPNPGAMLAVFVMFGIFWIVILFLIVIVSIGFTFAHPLIVDRKMQGFDAVKLSFKGAMANFWRLLGMALLTFILNIAGVLLCYIGVFLVLPIGYAAIAKAYEQVFGLHNPGDVLSDLPPPPPTFT